MSKTHRSSNKFYFQTHPLRTSTKILFFFAIECDIQTYLFLLMGFYHYAVAKFTRFMRSSMT